MKYLKIISIALLVCFLLSGCSFRMASSIDDLISPISPFGDNANIQSAMDAFAKNGYSLKTPSSGDYITSYNFYDIDSDGIDEAFAFYEPNDNLGTVDLAVLDKNDDSWSVVCNIDGVGKDVYSLSFSDITGDSVPDVIVCWDVISNSSTHELVAYKYNSDGTETSLKSIDDSITVSNYICVDMNSDSVNELLVFKINSASRSSAKAELYYAQKGSMRLLGETKLDSHILSYSDLKIENAENDIRVYADAIGSDGKSMLTEVIYWSDTYNTIISPFYSYSTGLTKETSRNSMVNSVDLNDDGLIEIPTDKQLKKLPTQVKAVDWKIYKNTTLIHTDYTLLVRDDRYQIVIPDKYINKISVSYDEKSSVMTVSNKDTKKDIFSVTLALKANFDKSNYSGYEIILENSGYYYLAKLGNDNDINLSINELKQGIKSV